MQDRIKEVIKLNAAKNQAAALDKKSSNAQKTKSTSNNSKVKNNNVPVPDSAIKHLKLHPDTKSDFDAKYGQGMSDKYLGNQ
jgi:ribosomal protein L13E